MCGWQVAELASKLCATQKSDDGGEKAEESETAFGFFLKLEKKR